MTNFEEAVEQVIEDSERLHKVVNGSSVDTIVVEDGSVIPSLRKAIMDNLYFKTPAMPWIPGTVSTVFNQLYSYHSAVGVQWWYAPAATATAPISLPVDPTNNVNWRLYLDGATMAKMYAPLDSPVLIGNPQAPTPLQTSNTTTIATTAFVKVAIADALSGFTGGPVTVPSITVTGAATITTLTVGGASIFTGPVTLQGNLTGDNTAARLDSLTLTKELSALSFAYSDPLTPTNRRTRVTPYQIQAHQVDIDRLLSGIAVADDTTMSTRAIGNSLFDYVYIRGNNSKPVTAPRLVVDGVTRLQNLEITGSLTGVSFSVDGQVTRPMSVETVQGVTVGTDLVVTGNSDLGVAIADSLSVSGVLSSTGIATVGGLNTGSSGADIGGALHVVGAVTLDQTMTVAQGVDFSSTLSVGGMLTAAAGINVTGNASATGNISAAGDLTIVGNADLNSNGTGTTKVHNLEISGTVTGLVIDLTGEIVNVAVLNASGNASVAGSLSVTGNTSLKTATVGFLNYAAEEIDSSGTAWEPSGTANTYTLVVDGALTIGKWPGVDDPTDKPESFHSTIYLTQDATGHAVTLDPTYFVINNAQDILTTPNSVTILRLSYDGISDVVDVEIIPREKQKGVTGGISWTKVNGVVEQWGKVTVPLGGETVTLPIAMPNAEFNVLVSSADDVVAVGVPVSTTEVKFTVLKQGATALEDATGDVYFTVKSNLV